MSRARVAVLVHAADRTGPPMYLLQLLDRLPTDDLDIVFVFLRGGELLSRFARHGEVHVVGEPAFPVPGIEALRAREVERVAARRAQLATVTNLDLVVVNTAWSTHARTWLPPNDAPVVTLVHEMEAGLGDLLPAPILELVRGSDRLVAGCRPVVELLVHSHGVSADRVRLVPYGAPAEADASVAMDLQVDHGAFTVVAAAVPNRRKGPDLFVQVARAARLGRPDVAWAFRWIGANDGDPRLADARRDIDLYGLGDVVRFLPVTAHLRATLTQAHAFVLPSREDAFPLVVLESLLAEVPVACFDTGGAPDVVAPGAGAVVEFPAVEDLADVLARWHDEPAERVAAGRAGRARVLAAHDLARHAAGVRAVLDEVLSLGRRAGPGRPEATETDPAILDR
ncbi:MAG: glycosyltransferase family 4 protein [Acidimicrobiales bacterium]|nr:glycosyltransferase family 4 protein [Acidimicrobiales bacterium]